MTRSQLNIRVDSKLLSAIQSRAKRDGVPLIDWVTNALQLALSAEVKTAVNTTSGQPNEALSEVLERLSQVEDYQRQCENYFPSLEKWALLHK